jgi:hypothetical protein
MRIVFQRYTEKARRTIFFARYEASQFGSPYIETEHLLLGTLRADATLSRRLLPNLSMQALQNEVQARTANFQKIPTSVDLPLSNESKRALAYAAEEAERLRDKHLGSEHLLLGLLRSSGSLAAELLHAQGVTLASARAEVAKLREKPSDDEAEADLTEIHGEAWHTGSLLAKARELRRYAWRQRPWKPLDILVEKDTGGIFFDLSWKDDPGFELRPGGWPQTNCEICGWRLNVAAGPEHATGYTNGRDWVCVECYTKFLSGSGPASSPKAD